MAICRPQEISDIKSWNLGLGLPAPVTQNQEAVAGVETWWFCSGPGQLVYYTASLGNCRSRTGWGASDWGRAA